MKDRTEPLPLLPGELPLRVAPDSAQPLYAQLEAQLRELIHSGALPEDSQLPSLRDLASKLGCSLITVRRVYLDLEREGLLTISKGIGTFVCRRGSERSARRAWSKALVQEAFRSAVATGSKYGLKPDEMRRLLEDQLEGSDSGPTADSGGDEPEGGRPPDPRPPAKA
ncbi:GntR family transcriptional regulator [Paenibacillus albicereus]|uniref:GntR family transcriptional regulator n=1 Tax=Paenibacillus albicereus TaxID=2726185 RepID=A0A6H2GSQ3_9BACL|nr:GntR family transcriptional regulator [Paenibacillus albicereus]QJC50427.1 GntR family transcriptional regulator [Paenibacillus albicereus]